jgi:hypothetical protein
VATASKPDLLIDIDFADNPTSGFFDQIRYDGRLVSYWRCNSGSTFLDELGVNNGVITGSPSTGAGALPNDADLALTFNGSSQESYVLDSGSLTPTRFTLQGWIKVASLPGSTKSLVGKAGSYYVQLTSTGVIFSVKNDTTKTTVQSGAGISTGTWYLITCTYDGATARIYINGILDQAATHTVGTEVSPQPLRFAAVRGTTSPAYASTQTANGTGTAMTINVPASTGAGDVLLMHLNTAEAVTITDPAGWTLIRNDGTAGQNRSRIYLRVAGGSEPASYTWTLSATPGVWNAAMSRFTGCDPISPLANPGYGVATPSGTVHATGSHLPNVDADLICAFFTSQSNGTFTEDAGTTERYDFNGGSGSRSIAMSTIAQATASAINVTGTCSGSNVGTAQMIVLAGTGLVYTACSEDEWSFWDDALSASDARQHYEARLGGGASWVTANTNGIPDGRSFSASMGHQYERDQVGAGTGSGVLNDFKRTYDPANTLSAQAPNVVPLRKIRVRLTNGTTIYPILSHFVEAWAPDASQTDAEVGLQTVDGFEPLGLAGVSGTLPAGFSGAQINTLLDKATWPRADRAIDTGQFSMVAAELAPDAKALPEIQAIQDSELGLFFVDAAGIATFHDYAHRWLSARSITSQATFADDGTFLSYHGFDVQLDKERTINEWQVATATGAISVARDDLSISKFRRRTSGVRATRLTDPADALTQATMLLQQTARPSLRFSKLTVKPGTNATAWSTVLGLTLSDRVTVVRNPMPAANGSQIREDCFIEGIAWDFPTAAQADWSITLSLSLCSPGSFEDTLLRFNPVSVWPMDTVT